MKKVEPTKVMLITGGGRGIGAATARLAAERGYAVAVNYRGNASAAQEVVRNIESQGGRAVAIQADVSSENEVKELFASVDRELGPLHALVNNAGILDQQMRLDQMSLERWQRVLAVNLTGVFLSSREAVLRMSTRHGGQGGGIVNVSSTAAQIGAPGQYIDYAASKGGLESLTMGLAKEVAHEGIRVNGVRPGFIDTNIHADGGEPDRIENIKDSVPMKRGGEAMEVARAILWLLSDEASYTTGSFIDVTGGR